MFRPRAVPTLVTLALLPVLVSLGFWQLQRADEKRAIQAGLELRAQQPPLRLVQPLGGAAEAEQYRALLIGRYDTAHQLLLDNRTHQGKAGYEVLTPLHVSGSELAVLVNRGWIPQGRSRAEVPLPAAPRSEVMVHGVLKAPPTAALKLGEGYRDGTGWPAVVQWVDVAALAVELGYPLQPVVVLQDPSDPGGFVREWKWVVSPPEKNLSYAVQWFALAAALLIIFVVVNLRRKDTDER
ncbi:MAG: SURF1 family protein [Pseudomonadota bacterium]|nr:MAG: SURF1 family protein [Pseudomonadota bacterium]